MLVDRRYKPWLACASDDTRPALAHVYIEPLPEAEQTTEYNAVAVAADEYMLVVVPVVTLDEDIPVLVHRRYWSRALQDSPRKLGNYQIGLGKVGGLMTLGINGWGAKRTEPADTNGFPKWRQIVPRLPKIALPPDARNLGLNALLLWRAQQAIGSEHGLCLTITSRTIPVIVEPLGHSRQNDCLVPPYAVVMPMYLAQFT